MGGGGISVENVFTAVADVEFLVTMLTSALAGMIYTVAVSEAL